MPARSVADRIRAGHRREEPVPHVRGPIVKRSRLPFEETCHMLVGAISRAGALVFTSIDQRDAAHRSGLSLRPTFLIIFGNPNSGTPLMADFPLAALELPLKILVWEDAGVVSVAFTPVGAALSAAGVPADDPRIGKLDSALETISDAVT